MIEPKLSSAAWRLVGLIVLLAAPGTAGDLPAVRWEGRTMGSPYTVQIVSSNLEPARLEPLKAEVEARLKEVNRQMSHYQPDSELSQFNRAPAGLPFKVSPGFARVVRFALELCRRSRGAFDPTLGPVINLWGFGEQTERRLVPSPAELTAALATTGCQHLSITANDELVKDTANLALNLSGVAKGFGVDEVVRLLRGHGYTNTYVSIAGEVMVLGRNARGTHWQVGISEPVANWNESDPMAAVASLSNRAISTSGDYQKFFMDPQGRRLCHIFDPRTGWPVQNNVGGVSVVAPDSMTADALATTLFVLGETAGLKFIEAWPDTAAVFILHESEGKYRQVRSSRFAELAGTRP